MNIEINCFIENSLKIFYPSGEIENEENIQI